MITGAGYIRRLIFHYRNLSEKELDNNDLCVIMEVIEMAPAIS